MARTTAQKNYFTYVKGLITEASPLNSPSDSSSDEDNMDLNRNGTRIRRRGLDYEKGGTTAAFTYTHTANYFDTGNHVVSVHEWRSIGGIGSNNKSLVQMGAHIYMLGLDDTIIGTGGSGITFDNTALGGGAADSSISLALVAVASADTGLDKVQISFGKGVAFVVGPNINPFYIEYVESTGNYTTKYVGGSAGNITIRDFAGVDSGIAVDTRPTYASWAALVAGNPNHAYNLLNQGWTVAHGTTYTASGVAPSNSDVWWYGKDSTGTFTVADMDKIWFGSMRSAQGRYILPAFAYNRASIIAGTTDFSTNARPSVTTFYSGRVWYTGIQDNQYSGTILFSRLIEDPALDAHRCHMDADPTSEIISDLVASDGGTITIPEAGEIIKAIPAANGLLIFARNGVWHIKGDQNTGFSANGFSVLKVTNVGCNSPDSIVEVEGAIMYWARSGIYLVSIDRNSFNMAAQNITQDTIQTRIDAVSNASLPFVKGAYDPLEREVKWCYTETLDAYPDYCNKFLTLDLVLKAWYPGTISGDNTNPFVVAPMRTLNIASTAPDYESMVRFITFKQATSTTMQVFASVLYDNRLVDWYTDDSTGIAFDSFVETTYELFDDAMRDKNIDDVHIYFTRTEHTITNGVLDQASGCLMRYKFDWADDAASGLFTKQEQAYKFARPLTLATTIGTVPFVYGQNVISSKHNIRGNGRAFQLRLDSEGNKDMHVLGWAARVSGVTR